MMFEMCSPMFDILSKILSWALILKDTWEMLFSGVWNVFDRRASQTPQIAQHNSGQHKIVNTKHRAVVSYVDL